MNLKFSGLKNRFSEPVFLFQFYQVGRYASFLLASIIFAHLMDPVDLGNYEKVLFFSSSLSFFWVNGLVQYYLSNNKEPGAIKKVFISLLLWVGIAVVFFLVFSHTGLIKISLSGRGFLLYFMLNPFGFLLDHYLYLKRPQLLAFLCTLIWILFPLGGYVLYQTGGLTLVTDLLIFISLIRFIWLLWIVIYKEKEGDFSITWAYLSLPLVIAALVGGLGEFTDGWLVNHYYNGFQFALYRYGAKELPLTMLLANAFSNAMVPVFQGMERQNGLGEIKRKSRILLRNFSWVIIVLMLASPLLYAKVFGSAFVSASHIFNIYLLLVIFRLMFPQTILLALKHQKMLMWIGIIEIMVNVACSIWLNSLLGLPGIALGTVLAFGSEKIMLAWVLWKKEGIKPSEYIDLQRFFIAGSLLIVTLLLSLRINIDIFF